MVYSVLATALLAAAVSAVPHGPLPPPYKPGPPGHGPPGHGPPGHGPPGHGPPGHHPPPPPTQYPDGGFFVNHTILSTAGTNLSASYPRYVELDDGTILTTTALSRSGPPPYFPVFESVDGGSSWTYISNLTDQVNGFGFAAQPALTVLPYDIGAYKKGTVLGSGNSWSNTSTNIDLYASTDRGRTWEFVSNIARGTASNTTNGAHPIWEPTLLPYDGELVAYYSDQRDDKYGQKLAHQTPTDFVHWGPVVNDVADDTNYEARPGMTNVALIKPLGLWILVHENPVGNSSSYGVNYAVHYKLAKDPREFRFSEDLALVVNNKTAPNASPYVVWTPVGGPNGTIIVSDADNRGVFTNQAGGDINSWEEHGTAAGAVYSRAIQILKHHPDHLLIYGGDTYDGSRNGDHVPFSASVFNVNTVLTKGANDTSFP